MARSERLEIRCTPEEKARWLRLASGKCALGHWIRVTCNNAAKTASSPPSTFDKDRDIAPPQLPPRKCRLHNLVNCQTCLRAYAGGVLDAI